MKYLHRIERTALIWLGGAAMLACHVALLVCGSLLGAVRLTYKTWTE